MTTFVQIFIQYACSLGNMHLLLYMFVITMILTLWTPWAWIRAGDEGRAAQLNMIHSIKDASVV